MNEGQYDSKNVEHISIENIEVVSNGMDWKSRHLEAEKRKAEIRDRIHKQTEQGQKSAKDYFRPAKPTPSMKKKQIKFFPDVYKDRIGKSYNDYIAGHQMNLFEDFIGYQGSAVLDEPEQKTDTISVPILQCEEPENIPLPDLQEQPENVQRPGSEVVEKGMLT